MNRSSAATAPERTPWGLVILLGSLSAFAPLSIDMYLPALPSIGAALNATAAETQATMATFLAGMAVGQVVYGPASDRFGRRGPILLGVALYVAASAVCASAPNIETLVAARFVQALGGCAGAVVARAVVRDRFDHVETARTLSLMMLISGLAPVLAPSVGSLILAVGDWRAIFWTLMGLGTALGVSGLLFLKESRSAETEAQARAEHPIRAFWRVISQRRILGYVLAAGFGSAGLFGYISGSPDLMIAIYGLSPTVFGWLFGANAIGMVLASQVNRALLRRMGPDVVLACASLISAGVCTALAAAAVTGFGERWTVLPLLFLMMAGYGFVQGNATAGALSADPRRAGTVSGLMGAGSFALGSLSASLVGLFHDGTPRPMAIVIMVSAIGSAAALFALALPRERPA